jgi:hypothetical protein
MNISPYDQPLTPEEETQWRGWIDAGHLPFGDPGMQANRIARLFATLDAVRVANDEAVASRGVTAAELAYAIGWLDAGNIAGFDAGEMDNQELAETLLEAANDFRLRNEGKNQ